MRLFLGAISALARLQVLFLTSDEIGCPEALPLGSTLIVTSTADGGAGSLRDTITAANDGDTIQFDAALNGQTVVLTSGQLVIDQNITISGPGPTMLTVSRPSNIGRFRVFQVMSGHIVTIAGLTITGGYADASSGAGIANGDSTLTISNCVVTGNFSDSGVGGGGISNSGTLTIANSVISNNHAGFTTGNPFGYGGGISSSGTLIINQSQIINNTADLDGGGIIGSGMITISDSTISGNRAGSGGLNGSGIGGGIWNDGTMEIRNSTISGNTAGGNGTGIGGGLVSGQDRILTISNSTISSNFANQDGGGILNNGLLTILNSTVSENRANRDGGGIISYAALEIGNTIFKAGASGTNIYNNGGTVTSRGYNISSDNGGGFLTAAGDLTNTDPILGPLQDNGGPTFTHMLLMGSPAINAGDPNFTPPPLYDQRGSSYARVVNGRIDIGSLEVQPTPTNSPSPTPTNTPTPQPATLANISTRLQVGTGGNVMIAGFIVTGTAPKRVIIRAIGPSLSGVPNVLVNPRLELHDGSGANIGMNDNWQTTQLGGIITSDQVQDIQNSGLAPTDPAESAIIGNLTPGVYTAIVEGVDAGTGVGLVEVYDLDTASNNSRLANISTRGFVQTGNDVMIGGIILVTQSTQVMVRAIGPSLAQAGVPDPLANPQLELHDVNGTLIAQNNDWQTTQIGGIITMDQVAEIQNSGLAPTDSAESVIIGTLQPGAYTAIVRGVKDTTGNALVEVYGLQ